MKIIIGQCKTRNKFPFNLFALLIMFFQKTKYSHYYLAYPSVTGNMKYLDATFFTVRDRLHGQFDKEYDTTGLKHWVFDLNVDETEFYRWVEELEGKGYAFDQILGLLLVISGVLAKNPFKNGTARLICNELVLNCLKRFHGLRIEDIEQLDLVDTARILDEL